MIFSSRIRRLWRNDQAAQIVEFAISLPVLLLFVIGIFDFSSAFTLKQKLTNVARDAARAAAADPSNDLASPSFPLPASVTDAFQIVDSYLVANKINDCGIANTGNSALTWTFTGTANGCPPAGITLTINRGYVFVAGGGAPLPAATCAQPTKGAGALVVATCVGIQYAYPWTFSRVTSVFFGTTTLPSTLTATAVAMNEN